jgi:AcrR family transcriptional regulator
MPTARSAPSTGPRTQRRGAGSAKSAQRIVDIVRASRAVFSERGYEATTTTEIADRLGISEGTIFTYFSGKRDLCARVIEDWYDEIIAQIEDGMPRGRSLRAQFAFVVRAHLRLFLVQGTGMCALVLTEGRAKGQPLGNQLVPLQRRYTAPLMELLARGQADGAVRADVPLRLLRSLVYGPMEHILWEAVAAHKPIDIDAAAAELIGVLWPMLQAPRAELATLRRLRARIEAALDESAPLAR